MEILMARVGGVHLALLWQIMFARNFSQWEHRLGGGRAKRSRMACLMAGHARFVGGGPPTLFFPPRCLEAAGLEEGVGDHGHQGVSGCNPVQDRPSK